MPKIELPYEFISPYPPDECVERLKREYGDHESSVIQVRIKPQPDASYFFQVHIFARSFIYIAFDLMIDGYIESVSGLYLLCVWIWRYARSTALQELTYLIEKTLLDEELRPLSASPSRWPKLSLGEKLKRGR
jgi:hypothetical protein